MGCDIGCDLRFYFRSREGGGGRGVGYFRGSVFFGDVSVEVEDLLCTSRQLSVIMYIHRM